MKLQVNRGDIAPSNTLSELVDEQGFISVSEEGKREVTMAPYTGVIDAFRDRLTKDTDGFFETLTGPISYELEQIYGTDGLVEVFQNLTLDVLERHLKGRNPNSLTKKHFSKVCNNAVDEIKNMGDQKVEVYNNPE